MASTKDIRNRIASVKSTQQTTKAMKMVAAVKLRKAQEAVVHSRPYAFNLRSVTRKIAEQATIIHPLLEERGEVKRVLLIILTSDRGLCGNFNGSINKAARLYYEEKKSLYDQLDLFFIGKKGFEYFKRFGVEGKKVVTNLDKNISYNYASDLSEQIVQWFLGGDYDEVQMIYNEFVSALSQLVICEKILPIESLDDEKSDETFGDIIFEPSPEVILDNLLKKNLAIQVHRIMQESMASEYGARMNSMENATKNAGEMIDTLTLTLNKLRQAAITTELIEITSGAEALKG